MEEYREKLLKDKIKKIQDRQKLKIQQHEKRLKTEANNNEKNLKSVGSDQDYGDDIYNLNSKYKAQMIRKMQKEEEDNFCLETEERLKLNEKEHRRNYLQYLKKLTKKLKDGSENYKKVDPKLEAICHDLEEKMKGILGTKVAINQKDNKKGKIEIEYYSMDELDRIMDLFRTIEK